MYVITYKVEEGKIKFLEDNKLIITIPIEKRSDHSCSTCSVKDHCCGIFLERTGLLWDICRSLGLGKRPYIKNCDKFIRAASGRVMKKHLRKL